jgi:hypothetical protein
VAFACGFPQTKREECEILDQLGQTKCFSCLDMVMGYHQIEVEEKDREETAFSTKKWSLGI